MITPVEANLGEGSGDELLERVRHTRSNDESSAVSHCSIAHMAST